MAPLIIKYKEPQYFDLNIIQKFVIVLFLLTTLVLIVGFILVLTGAIKFDRKALGLDWLF